MKNAVAAVSAFVVLCFAQVAGATFVDLYEMATVHDPASEKNLLAPLGTFALRYNTPGLHHGGLYLDYELNEPDNTNFNEYGAVHGTAPQGLRWEIDEPGYGTAYTGDIWDNFKVATADGQIFNGLKTGPEDVGMALLWNFSLGLNETAEILFTASMEKPGDDSFYLMQSDGPNGEDAVYFSSKLTVSPAGAEPIPEPGTSLLVGLGLTGLAFFARKKRLS